MGVPKRRHSHSRKNKRRAMWRKMEAPAVTECPQCHELKQPHRVCPACGFYKGKSVVAVAN